MRIPWRFTDPKTNDIYYAPVNPNADAGSWAISKRVGYAVVAGEHKVGPDLVKSTVLYSTGPEMGTLSYSGNLYTQVQVDDFTSWMMKDYPIQLLDDLGREGLVFIENYSLERKSTEPFPWKHSYTFSASVLERIS